MRLSLALIPHSQVADQAHQTIVNTAKFKHQIFSLLFLDSISDLQFKWLRARPDASSVLDQSSPSLAAHAES